MKKTGIFYSFNTKVTASIAEKIRDQFGDDQPEMINVEETGSEQLKSYENIICGVSTWFDGELPNYWDEFVPEIEETDLKGKKVAIFGPGDQENYPENFVDAMGILGNILEQQGAVLVGFTLLEGYEFEKSAAVREGKFIGLPIDEVNQAKMTGERVKKWVEQLKKEFS